MPDHAATDDGREVHCLGETAAGLFIGQEIDGQRQPTPGEHRDQPVVAERTDEAGERHGRDRVEHRAQLHTETAVRGPQRITGDLRSPLTIAENDVGEHRAHRATRGALDAPDGEAAQTGSAVMRVARQAPTAATGCLVGELKAKGQEKGEDAFDKRLAVAQELNVGHCIVEIDGDGAVFSRRFGRCAHAVPRCHQVS